MAPCLSVRGVSKSWTADPVFTRLDLDLHAGRRLGLIGANGSGKSTLLRILAGSMEPDEGERMVQRGLRIAAVAQDEHFTAGVTVDEVLRAALPADLDESLVDRELGRLRSAHPLPDGEQLVQRLSGGWRKRLALVAALAGRPEVLLLDEPSNHLDLDGLLWLERLILDFRGALALVTHDRELLRRCADEVAEIGRQFPGGCLRSSSGYAGFLEQRAGLLAAQTSQAESLSNVMRREVEWLRKRPKARTTKSVARIERAADLSQELATLTARNRAGAGMADIVFSGGVRRANELLITEGLSVARGERQLINNLDLTLAPGMRLGLVGGNGSGKSSLLHTFAGDLAPSSGRIRRAHGLRIIHFHQHRQELDGSRTVQQTFCPEGGDQVVQDGRSCHVRAWAQRFRFGPERLDQRVDSLSGGERARLAISSLMTRPADLLLLDEPTNDLDIPTLELLEAGLLEFGGAVVLVSHDRYFLDKVATCMLALDGQGGAHAIADHYQWEDLRQRLGAAEAPPAPATPAPSPKASGHNHDERREYQRLPARIEKAEAALEAAHSAAAAPDVVVNHVRLASALEAVAKAQAAVDVLYQRWEELEARA